MPILTILSNIVLEVLARATRQEKETESTQIGKEEVKLPLFIDDMIMYIQNSQESPIKLAKNK